MRQSSLSSCFSVFELLRFFGAPNRSLAVEGDKLLIFTCLMPDVWDTLITACCVQANLTVFFPLISMLLFARFAGVTNN